MKATPETHLTEPIIPEQQGARSTRKRRMMLIKSAISVGLIAFVLSRVDIRQTMEVLSNADFGLLMIAWSLTFMGAVLTTSRWRVLLEAQGVHATRRHLIACWMTACFFNQFLPSTIGGDAIRIYDSWKLGATKAGAAAVIGVDRLLGLFALMMFGVVALYLSTMLVEEHPEIRLLVVGAVVSLGMIAAWIFYPTRLIDNVINRLLGVFPRMLRRMIEKFHQALTVYRGRGGVLAKAMFFSAALQFNVIVFYFLIGTALGLDIRFLDYMLIIPVVNVILLLPITINGVGLREGIFVVLLSAFGVAPAASIAFAWASFLLLTLYGLLGGIVYAVRKDVKRVANAG